MKNFIKTVAFLFATLLSQAANAASVGISSASGSANSNVNLTVTILGADQQTITGLITFPTGFTPSTTAPCRVAGQLVSYTRSIGGLPSQTCAVTVAIGAVAPGPITLTPTIMCNPMLPTCTTTPGTITVTGAAAITAATPTGSTIVLPEYLTPGPGSSSRMLSFGGSGQLACVASGAGYTVTPNPLNVTVTGQNVVTVTYTGTVAGNNFPGSLVCTPVAPATGGPFSYTLNTTVRGVPVITTTTGTEVELLGYVPGTTTPGTATIRFAITGGPGQMFCVVSGAGYAAPSLVNLTVAGPNEVVVSYTGTAIPPANRPDTLTCTPNAPATGGPFTYSLKTKVNPTNTASLTTTTLSFESAVNTPSATKNVVITAAGNSGSITITECTIGGANPTPYEFFPAFTQRTVVVGSTENVAIRFSPTSSTPASQNATVTCKAGAVVLSGTVTLNGTVTPAATAPGKPTITGVTAGNASVKVDFTAPDANGSAITAYTATCGTQSGNGLANATSITVNGLANNVGVKCFVVATNAIGNSPPSDASNLVTPTQPVTASINTFTANPSTGPSGTPISLTWITNVTGNICTVSLNGTNIVTGTSPQAVTATGATGAIITYTLTCPGVAPPKDTTFTILNTITDTPTVTAITNNPVATTVLAPVNDLCSALPPNNPPPGSPLEQQCKLLANQNAPPTAVVSALVGLAPEEQSAVVTNSQDNLNFANAGATNRLAALRGGATRQSVDDLAFNYDGKQIPTGALAGALGALLGFTQDDEAPAGGGLLDNRFGFFGQALMRRGNRDTTPTESSFDFDGYQAIIGGDYRFTNRFVAGLALGGGKTNADLGGSGGKLDTRARFFTGYALYAPNDRAYLELAITRLRNDYKQERVIDLRGLPNSGSIQNPLSTAFGDTSGNQTSASLSAGYSYKFGATSVTPSLRASFGKTQVDGFNETGVSPFLLRIDKQSFDSLQYGLGVNIQRSISLESGVLAPYANFELVFERKYDSFTLNSCFLAASSCAGSNPFVSNAIVVNIAKADSRFGRGELGFTYLTEGGLQLGVAYTETLGYSFLTSRSISLTGRYEF